MRIKLFDIFEGLLERPIIQACRGIVTEWKATVVERGSTSQQSPGRAGEEAQDAVTPGQAPENLCLCAGVCVCGLRPSRHVWQLNSEVEQDLTAVETGFVEVWCQGRGRLVVKLQDTSTVM